MLFGGLASTSSSSSTQNNSSSTKPNKRRKRRQFYITEPTPRYSLSACNSSAARSPVCTRHASLSPTALQSISFEHFRPSESNFDLNTLSGKIQCTKTSLMSFCFAIIGPFRYIHLLLISSLIQFPRQPIAGETRETIRTGTLAGFRQRSCNKTIERTANRRSFTATKTRKS